jgi:hypothetical protein
MLIIFTIVSHPTLFIYIFHRKRWLTEIGSPSSKIESSHFVLNIVSIDECPQIEEMKQQGFVVLRKPK